MDVENGSKEGNLASGPNTQGITVKVQVERESSSGRGQEKTALWGVQQVNLVGLDWVWPSGEVGNLEKNFCALPLYRTNIYLVFITR